MAEATVTSSTQRRDGSTQSQQSQPAEEGADLSGDTSATSNKSDVLTLTSTLSRGAYHQCGTARRVKVYELKGETWFDRGTGYCAGVYDEQNDAALLVARMEETCRRLALGVIDGTDETQPRGEAMKKDDEAVTTEGKEDRDHYVLVVSEGLDSDDLLLKARVVKDDVYQRQQDTLVVWTEPDGTDMALSFQEADGCHEVWEFLTEVQKHFLMSASGAEDGLDLDDDGMNSGMLGMSAAGMTTENDLVMSDGSPFALPHPNLNNLLTIDVTLKDAASRSPQAREKVAEWILREDYVPKLVNTFHDAEELEQLDTLHRLCAIMHTVIMLNDNILVERLLRDDVFLGFVGTLEYDPEFPRLKASYREYLTHTARFKQVIPIADETIITKIHQTFRLQYLKDVILARSLDDSTFAVLNSLIFYHQADIVAYCTSSEGLLTSLFQVFEPERNETDTKRGEAILFLQQLCAVGKQVQLPSRLALYRTLSDWGLLIVLEYALGRTETRLRNAAAEIFMSIIEYDASGVRMHILDQVEKGASPLLTKLAEILHEEEGDLGLKTQITESLRILFDSGPDGSAGGPILAQTLAAAAAANQAIGEAQRKDETERFLNWFYDGEVDMMFAPLKTLKKFKSPNPIGGGSESASNPSPSAMSNGRASVSMMAAQSASRSALYNHLCELLTFMMIHHNFRAQYWVISSDIGARVTSLLFAREKHLRLAALRFFRACLAKGNQLVNRQFVKIGLLGAILSVIEMESPRDNLITSACLEFFEHIRKEPIKPLVNHLLERHEKRVRQLTQHVAIGHYFQAMILQWETNGETSGAGQSAMSNEDSSMDVKAAEAERERRTRDLARRGEDREMDEEEEAYFREEPETSVAATASRPQSMRAIHTRPRAGSGLVPYVPEDEEDDDGGETATNSNDESLSNHEDQSDNSSNTSFNAADQSLEIGSGKRSTPSKRKLREGEGTEDEEDGSMGHLAKRKSVSVDSEAIAAVDEVKSPTLVKKKTPSIRLSTSAKEPQKDDASS
jgi:protein phosphatase-4 regulatory subunit 3